MAINIKWKEVFKFLSGAAFVGTLVNFYLWLHDISLPFFGYTITPPVLGIRAMVGAVLFVVFFYFGYVKKS